MLYYYYYDYFNYIVLEDCWSRATIKVAAVGMAGPNWHVDSSRLAARRCPPPPPTFVWPGA